MMSYKECQERHEVGYVYKLQNKLNGMIYVGCTVNPQLRLEKHIQKSKDLNDYRDLYKDIREIGIDNFLFKILEETNLDNMYNKEKEWIAKLDSFNNGYNRTEGGEGGNTYAKRSEIQMLETGARISRAIRGSKNGNKGQYIGEKNPMYGSYPHNKRLFLFRVSDKSFIKAYASELKVFLGLRRLRELNKLVESQEIINGFIVAESQETIEELTQTYDSEVEPSRVAE